MNRLKFFVCCAIAGLLSFWGSGSLLAQERSAMPTEVQMKAWRGRASPPSPTGPTEEKIRAVGTAGTIETAGTPTEVRMKAWRGRASPPTPTAPTEVEIRAVGTAGTIETTETPTEVQMKAWRGRASSPSPDRR